MWKLFLMLGIPLTMFLSGCSNLAVLNPKGPVAKEQAHLITWSTTIMAIFIAAVFIVFAFVIIKYREKPGMEDYIPPDQHGNLWLEIAWTFIPLVIVTVLTIPTIKSNYHLEESPKKDVKPIVVNVTSADWKWIFSYPDLGIETVNYLAIPEDTPIQFKLTSADNMNSFWVPELGGQKYTMAGMETKMYLEADQPGDYEGRSANFSGEGFTNMTFTVEAKTSAKFEKWVKDVKKKADPLTKKEYNKILEPGNVGRMTFTGTHLQWIDHSKVNTHGHNSEEMDMDMDMNMEHGGE